MPRHGKMKDVTKSQGKGGAKRTDLYVIFHPNLSNADPLLIVRLSYDSNPPKRNIEKRRLQWTSRAPNRLVFRHDISEMLNAHD